MGGDYLKTLISNSYPWFKGNLHMHTTKSDGQLSPEDATKLYREAGYDFIALTDHRQVSYSDRDQNMLILPGVEWDCGNSAHPPVYHIVSIGGTYEGCMLPTQQNTPQEIIDLVNAAGGVAILAHPTWSLMDPNELYDLKGIAATEIFNSASDFPHNAPRADASHYFDLWAMKGRLMPAVATDDSHPYKSEATRSYTMVQAESLTEENIIKALKEGNFYASQGPRFKEVSYDCNRVIIRFSEDVKRVYLYSNSVWVDERVFIDPEGEVIYEIMPTDRYLRIELVDSEGRRAWSSPFAVVPE